MKRDERTSIASAMTLIEVVIAVTILVLVVSAAVAFLATCLGMWDEGETSRDLSERAQAIVGRYADDFRHLFVEYGTERLPLSRRNFRGQITWEASDRGVPAWARFLCAGRGSTAQILTFVRTADFGTAGEGNGYAELQEVVYLLDTRNGKSNLWRGVQPFDRSRNTFFDDTYLRQGGRAGASSFSLVDRGLLFVEYRFWTKYTTTWNPDIPPVRTPSASQARNGGRAVIGPSLLWDSKRELDGFFLERGAPDPQSPDFVFPSAVQVVLVLEREGSKVRLASELREDDLQMSVENADDLPSAPALVRIEDEWIEYREKKESLFAIARRGARRTAATKHPAGAPVRYGDEIVFEIPLPAYRHQEE